MAELISEFETIACKEYKVVHYFTNFNDIIWIRLFETICATSSMQIRKRNAGDTEP